MPQTVPADIFKSDDQQRRLQAEAAFGLSEMLPFFEGPVLPNSVLEVGCGTGVLLSKLSQLYPEVRFTGLEPIGAGFAQFTMALERIKAQFANITFIHDRVEDVKTTERFDLIFSVNVFEHLDDWRRATDVCISLLAPHGKLVVLCPNYSVPYESHFGLPILGSKAITYRVFRKRINHLEEKLDIKGLWRSLNFITSSQLVRHCRAKGYYHTFDNEVMKRMLDRLDTDSEFRNRQARIAKLARLANQLGIGTACNNLPVVFGAYMKAIIEHER